MNDEIKELMKKRDSLHRVVGQTKTICDLDSFCVTRNEVKKTLREAEKGMSKMKFTKIKNRMQCGKLLGDACLAKRYQNSRLY